MSTEQLLRSLVREAELYRIQGLLAQSKEKYTKVLALAEKSRPSQKRQKVIDAVKDRIQTVDRELAQISEDEPAPELPAKVYGLIKKLFSFSKTEETAALEGAIALAKFGQYAQALDEFNHLLKQKHLTLIVAKNILRCHLSLASPQASVDQFVQWAQGPSPLQKKDLGKIRDFLESLLEGAGVDLKIPDVPEDQEPFESHKDFEVGENLPDFSSEDQKFESSSKTAAPSEAFEPASEHGFVDLSALGSSAQEVPNSAELIDDETDELDDILDVSSIKVRFTNQGLKGKVLELKVTFQVGNVVSVILPANKRPLLRYFRPETELAAIQVFSSMTDFEASGKVLGRTDVKSGPNKGDFMLDILIYAS